MGCLFPMKGYHSIEKGPSGKPLITFNPLRAIKSDTWLQIPCNQCMGCRLERARQWAVRMRHESKLYDENCFITLTYDNENVPEDFSLKLHHWQDFMKRLRWHTPDKYIRFFACGEYGDENLRPHYHAIIFNHDFADKRLHAHNRQGQPIYVSEKLTSIWKLGHAVTQDVTFKSCSYVARYVTKKQNGDLADSHYSRVSPVDGKLYNVRPEFAVMSRRPGIGSGYIEKFKADFFPSGFLVVDGRKQAPPQYYLDKLTEEEKETLKRQRKHRSIFDPENTMERKQARAAVLRSKTDQLKRKL